MALIDEVRVMEADEIIDMASFEGVLIVKNGNALRIRESESPDMANAREMQGEAIVKGSICYGDVYRPARRYLQVQGGGSGVCLQYGVRINPGSIDRDWNAGKFLSPPESAGEVEPSPEPLPPLPGIPEPSADPKHNWRIRRKK